MLDITKSYDNYIKTVKTNEKVLAGINNMLTCKGALQLGLLQCVACSESGVSLETITKFGFDKDVSIIILQELVRDKFVIYNKDTKYFTISTLGKNTLVALNFRSLELMNI